jgi:hypothetical protein
VALVRERTILTGRPPIVGEVSANFCELKVLRGQRNGYHGRFFSVFRPKKRHMKQENHSVGKMTSIFTLKQAVHIVTITV